MANDPPLAVSDQGQSGRLLDSPPDRRMQKYFHSAAADSGICWSDPDIAIAWPFKDADIIMSNKDRRLPLLKEFASPFEYDGHPLGPSTESNV